MKKIVIATLIGVSLFSSMSAYAGCTRWVRPNGTRVVKCHRNHWHRRWVRNHCWHRRCYGPNRVWFSFGTWA